MINIPAILDYLRTRPYEGKGPGRKLVLTPEDQNVYDVLEFCVDCTTDWAKSMQPKSGPALQFDRVPTGMDGKGVHLMRRGRKIVVEIVNDYYDPRDAKHDRSFKDTDAEYLKACEYFCDLCKLV